MQNSGIESILRSAPRLLAGIWVTVKISMIALALSIVLGLIIGFAMTSKNKVLGSTLRTLLEAFRLIHPLVWLFIFFYGFAVLFQKVFHVDTNNYTVSIIVFTLWGTFEIGDLVRSYIKSLPASQFESSLALGLSKPQMYFYVILPQIVTRTIPSVVNLATRLIKTTTLVYLIGVPEVLKVSQSVIQVTYTNNPNSYISFTMYLLLLVVYFIICYPLSLFEKYLQKKVPV